MAAHRLRAREIKAYAGLRECEVVGVRGLAAADEARLLGDIAQVLRLRYRRGAASVRMLLSRPFG